MTYPKIAVCDRCGMTVRIPGGERLPRGWETDWATGEDKCPWCVDAKKKMPWTTA